MDGEAGTAEWNEWTPGQAAPNWGLANAGLRSPGCGWARPASPQRGCASLTRSGCLRRHACGRRVRSADQLGLSVRRIRWVAPQRRLQQFDPATRSGEREAHGDPIVDLAPRACAATSSRLLRSGLRQDIQDPSAMRHAEHCPGRTGGKGPPAPLRRINIERAQRRARPVRAQRIRVTRPRRDRPASPGYSPANGPARAGSHRA